MAQRLPRLSNSLNLVQHKKTADDQAQSDLQDMGLHRLLNRLHYIELEVLLTLLIDQG
jgi:hypothetical protein